MFLQFFQPHKWNASISQIQDLILSLRNSIQSNTWQTYVCNIIHSFKAFSIFFFFSLILPLNSFNSFKMPHKTQSCPSNTNLILGSHFYIGKKNKFLHIFRWFTLSEIVSLHILFYIFCNSHNSHVCLISSLLLRFKYTFFLYLNDILRPEGHLRIFCVVLWHPKKKRSNWKINWKSFITGCCTTQMKSEVNKFSGIGNHLQLNLLPKFLIWLCAM